MKVLLINNFFFRNGGSEAVYFNTADLLRKAGHEVVFFSFEDERNIQTPDPVYLIPHGGTVARLRSFFSNSEAAKALDVILEKEKPDIAHAHLFWGGISPSIIAVLHKHRIPFVHTAHDYRMVCPAYLLKDGKGQFCERCKGGNYLNCALHRCSKGSVVESILMTMEMYYRNKKWHPAKAIDGIIFVSNFSKNKHLEFDKRFEKSNTMVLYNCPGENVKESLDVSKDTFDSYYLFYGRLTEEKGIRTLLKVVGDFHHLVFKVVGTGPLEDELKQYCTENRIENVTFLGYKTGKELYDLVAGAKYVCVPSECYENNPMTIVEAYSLATPVIGAAIGGISEVINEGKTGYVFDSGSVEGLKNAIKKAGAIGRNEYEEQRKAALEFSEKNFSREKHLEKLLGFYRLLIER